MQVILGGPAAARLSEWRRRSAAVERSFLEVWARPTSVATAVFGLGSLSLILGRATSGSGTIFVDGIAVAGVLALGLFGRIATRGLDVPQAATEIVHRNTESGRRLRRVLDGLPEAYRREIGAEGHALFRGADGLAVVAATALAVLATLVSAVPAVSLVAGLGYGVNLLALIGALGVAAIVLPSLVRLIVATSAEAVRVRTALLDDLAAILEESRGLALAPVPATD